jgi:hypothetical protein
MISLLFKNKIKQDTIMIPKKLSLRKISNNTWMIIKIKTQIVDVSLKIKPKTIIDSAIKIL